MKDLTAQVHVITERVYRAAEKQGERPVVVEITEGTDSDAHAFATMPDDAWGWYTQRRITGAVEVDGTERELTSLPYDGSAMTWMDATELDIETVAQEVIDQEEYRQACDRARKPYGPLPHGRDQRPTLYALDKGDRIILTRTGERRHLGPKDRLVSSVDIITEAVDGNA